MRYFLLLKLFLAVLFISQVTASTVWINGTVLSTPIEASFGGLTYYMFDFNVTSGIGSLGAVRCVALKTLGPFNATPHLGDGYNFSAQYIASQLNNDSIPARFYLITGINANATSDQASDWVGALKAVFDSASAIGCWVVTFIVQVIRLGGVVLPDYVVAFVIAAISGILVFLRLRWWLTLGSLLVGGVILSFIIQTYLLLLFDIKF